MGEKLQHKFKSLLKELDNLPLPEQIDVINSFKLLLHKKNPFRNEPVDCVLWVKNERVYANGANSGALYIQEHGNINGYCKITKPENHTWKSFCNLLLQTMPKKTQEHYRYRFRKFIYGWKQRGYSTIPDESPSELESKCWAPSWRRMCKVLLRNDYWCKGLGQAQPKSEAYAKFLEIRKLKKAKLL